MKPSLNLGCGNDIRGKIRIDITPARKGITLLADAHFIPIRDKAISKTLCKSVLEHVENPFKVVREIKRITADEIILVVPNVINLWRIWLNLKKPLRQVNTKTKHLQGWDVKLLNHIANATGLKVSSFEWPLRRRWRWGFMFKPLLASHMIAVLYEGGGNK